MTARLPKRAALFLLACAVSLSLIAAPGASTTVSSASALRVTPGDHYVGGQALTFEGNIGKSGQNRITLQSHMNRPGDDWTPVDGFSDADRAERGLQVPVPGPIDVRHPLSGGVPRRRDPRRGPFRRSRRTSRSRPVTQPVAGEPFRLEVDTTPTLRRRPDTIGLKPIPGRELTLQRRVDGDTWQQVGDRTVVNENGNGTFTVTESQPGTVVYRALQGNWNQGSNKIGWFPSFPLYVRVQSPYDVAGGEATGGTPDSSKELACHQPVPVEPASKTASSVRGWAPSLFDFAWEFGRVPHQPPFPRDQADGEMGRLHRRWWSGEQAQRRPDARQQA